MELLRYLAQGFLDHYSSEEEKRESIYGEAGYERRQRREGCHRQLESVFGTLEFKRIGYLGRGLSILYPLDAQLNLPPMKYSHGLQSDVAHRVSTQSFDETHDSLERQGGGHVPKRQLQEVAAHLAQDFDAYYQRTLEASESSVTEVEGEAGVQSEPTLRVAEDTPAAEGHSGAEEPSAEDVIPATQEPPLLIITADGKGIAMHQHDLREATRQSAAKKGSARGRLQPGEKRHCKRMATVVAVYEIAPYYRSPEQIMAQNVEPRPQLRPEPVDKRVWANIVADTAEVMEHAFQEAERRDPEHQMKWVILVDGQAELTRQAKRLAKHYHVEIVIVQNLIHVIEYLWKAAHALHPDDAEARERWVHRRTLDLLQGRVQQVPRGLRRAATRAKLKDGAQEAVEKAATYIEQSQERLHYDQYLRAGLPIATGVIEGACRHLVKDRMDLTGARWRLKTADAILKLRSLKSSGDLIQYLAFHFDKEKERNYPEAENDYGYSLKRVQAC